MSLVTDIGASIAAISSATAVILGASNHSKIREVHLLVNSQLDDVMKKLEQRTAQRDELQTEKDDRATE